MAINGRDYVGRFQTGHSGGPGRPKNGVRAALARIVDFDEVAHYVYGVLQDPKAPASSRQWAAEFITDRLEGRAVQAVAMAVQTTTSAGLPENWDQLSLEEKTRHLDTIERLALGTGDR